LFSVSQNEVNENNRQKALTEKRRKVKLFSDTIDSITERYNLIVDTINAPSDYKFLYGVPIRILKYLIFLFLLLLFVPFLSTGMKTNTIHLELKKNITKKKKDTKVI
jgi:hypothetical protein